MVKLKDIKEKKTRSSNIELLRIFSMIMIIVYHIYYHCIRIELNDGVTTLFNHPLYYKKLWILEIISPMGKIANVIFILIAGYFIACKKHDIDLTKTAKKLLFQQLFAALSLVLISPIIYKIVIAFRPDAKITLLSINIFNNMSWFVGYYFLIILITKLFLNKLLLKFNQKQYTEFLLAFFAITQFSYAFSTISNIGNGLDTLVSGIFIFSLGGYIRKYKLFKNVKSYVFLLIIILTNILIILSNYNIYLTNVMSYTGDKMFNQEILGFSNYSLVAIVIGVSLFEIFRRLHVPNSKFINIIGSSTFMIYLFHDNDLFRSIWKNIDWIKYLVKDPLVFVEKYFIFTLIAFLAGFILYMVYDFLNKQIPKIKKVIFKK